MRQPENFLGLGLFAAHGVRHAGGNVGAGVLYSRAQGGFFALRLHDFASVPPFKRHTDLHAEARSFESREENQRNKGDDEDGDNQTGLLQSGTSVKKLPMLRNLLYRSSMIC